MASNTYRVVFLQVKRVPSIPLVQPQPPSEIKSDVIVQTIKKEPDIQPTWNFHKCKMCQYKTKSRYSITTHLRRHKVTKNSKVFDCTRAIEQHRCPKCKYRTPLTVGFNKHVEDCLRLPSHNYKTDLNQDLIKHNLKSLVKVYDCEKCSFRTFSQLMYVVHCRKCPVRNFLQKASLEAKVALEKIKLFKEKMQQMKAKPKISVYKPPDIKPMFFSVNNDTSPDVDSDDNGPDIEPLPPPPTPTPGDFINIKSDISRENKFLNFSSVTAKRNENLFKPTLTQKPRRRPKSRFGKHYTHKKHYQCQECPFTCALSFEYLTHLNETHAGQTGWLQCEDCQFTTMSAIGMQGHKTKCHSIKCTMCDYKVRGKKALKLHVKAQHTLSRNNKTLTMFKCDLCKFQTPKDEELQSHILKNHVSEEHVVCYKCKVCNFKTLNGDEVKKHVMENHIDPQHKEWFPCEMCDSKFKLRLALKKHIFAKHIM